MNPAEVIPAGFQMKRDYETPCSVLKQSLVAGDPRVKEASC